MSWVVPVPNDLFKRLNVSEKTVKLIDFHVKEKMLRRKKCFAHCAMGEISKPRARVAFVREHDCTLLRVRLWQNGAGPQQMTKTCQEAENWVNESPAMSRCSM
jgi:hypothetical protein